MVIRRYGVAVCPCNDCELAAGSCIFYPQNESDEMQTSLTDELCLGLPPH